MQSVMYELMSELNDRSEDLERQMLSLEQRVEQLTASFNVLPAHLSATLSTQHTALIQLLRERDAKLLSPTVPSALSPTAASLPLANPPPAPAPSPSRRGPPRTVPTPAAPAAETLVREVPSRVKRWMISWNEEMTIHTHLRTMHCNYKHYAA